MNSRNRDFSKYPDAGEYVIDLPRTYHNVVGAHLVSAEIPSSFYIFTSASGNTTLKIIVNDIPATITIPDGNYGFTSIMLALGKALNAAYLTQGFEFVAAADRSTGRVSFTCTSHPSTTTLAIDTTDAPADKPTEWGLAYFLGYPKGVITSGDPNTGYVIGPSCASLNPYTYILLNIEELNGTDHVGVEGGSSTFGKIPLTVNSFNFVCYDKVLSKQLFNPPKLKLNKLHISFTFHDDTPVDFHGMEHSFTMELICTEETKVERRF